MKKQFVYFFGNWLNSIILFSIIAGIFIVSELIKIHLIQNICFYLLLLGFLVLFASTIFQFVRKNRSKGALSMLIFVIACLGFLFYSWTIFWKIQSEPDKFADDLQIPMNVKIEFPSKSKIGTFNIELIQKDSINFQVYKSFQPGLYKYALKVGKIEVGTIYLKAFEMTKNIPLSTSKLKERSSIQVSNFTDSVKIFHTSSYFTIYEGDWGKPYGARFEVWFRPENIGKEIKIAEKNYIIEGWQR